jgi:hypothetical protein
MDLIDMVILVMSREDAKDTARIIASTKYVSFPFIRLEQLQIPSRDLSEIPSQCL